MPAPEPPWYVQHYTERCGAEFAASPLQVATKGGRRLPIHKEIIAAMAQVPATASAIDHSSGLPTPGNNGSRSSAAAASPALSGSSAAVQDALSVVTGNYTTAAVEAFLGQVYCLSGLLDAEAEEQAAAAWAALSLVDRGAAVELADALHSPRVLAAWSRLVEKHFDLNLAEAYHQQLPAAFASCMQQAKTALAAGGAAASPVLAQLPHLSADAASALLTHYAAAADGKVVALSAEAKAERAKRHSMWPAVGLTALLILLLITALTAGLLSERRVRLAVPPTLAAVEGAVKRHAAETARALEAIQLHGQHMEAHLAAVRSQTSALGLLSGAQPEPAAIWPSVGGKQGVHTLLQARFGLPPLAVDRLLRESGAVLIGDAMLHALLGKSNSSFSGSLEIIAPSSAEPAWKTLLERTGYKRIDFWHYSAPSLPSGDPSRDALISGRELFFSGRSGTTFSWGSASVRLSDRDHPLSVIMRSNLSTECTWYDGVALHSPFAHQTKQGLMFWARDLTERSTEQLAKYRDWGFVLLNNWSWVAGWQPDGTPHFAVVSPDQQAPWRNEEGFLEWPLEENCCW